MALAARMVLLLTALVAAAAMERPSAVVMTASAVPMVLAARMVLLPTALVAAAAMERPSAVEKAKSAALETASAVPMTPAAIIPMPRTVLVAAVKSPWEAPMMPKGVIHLECDAS